MLWAVLNNFLEDIIMSIKLAEGEKLIRTYDYGKVRSTGVASSGDSESALLVTNRRIIHRIAGHGVGKEHLSVTEMPLRSAKYVNTFYGMKSYPILFVLGILFVLSAIIEFSSSIIWVGIVSLVAAVACFVIFFLKKDYTVTCQIFAESYIAPAFYCSSRSGNSLTRGAFGALSRGSKATTINVKVSVNNEVAKVMADELGYVIQAAANGDFDEA